MINRIRILIRRYRIFIKYTLSAGIAFGIDLILFTVFNHLLIPLTDDKAIIFSTIAARILSSLLNYSINRNKVFENKKKNFYDKKTFTYYYLLVIIQLCISAISVFVIHKFIIVDATIIKIPVDIVIFIINYFVQKNIIFKE